MSGVSSWAVSELGTPALKDHIVKQSTMLRHASKEFGSCEAREDFVNIDSRLFLDVETYWAIY